MAPRLQHPTRLAICIGALAAGFALHDGIAQTADAPKSTTRVITLGTVAGPPPRAHRVNRPIS
jgi:hypothetical protein